MDRPKSWCGTEYSDYVDKGPRRLPDQFMDTILVVDHDRAMAQSVKALLESRGYFCLMAADGRRALQLLETGPIDLMILDLDIHDPDGFQILQHLDAQNADTDVIVVSSQGAVDQASTLLRHGVRNYLHKPYPPQTLLSALEQVATRRRIQHRQRKAHLQLLDSEQQHRFIVNNAPDVIYMLDHRGRFSFINQRVESLLGYRPEELLGRPYDILLHQEDRDQPRHAFAERRTGARASVNVECRLLQRLAGQPEHGDNPHLLPVELCAMGVYAEYEQNRREFVGTYGVIRDISERKRAEAQVRFQLHHDLLTKLPNRVLFRDRLKQAIAQARRNRQQLAVMYLDMDRFKIINDSLGHLMGDQLLQAVAVKLRRCLRDSDTLARVGGDEFNLLLPDISQHQDAATIAGKILAEIDKPIHLDGIEVFIGFSIGIAIYPEHGETIDTLIQHADTAMYHVKENGKKNFDFYRPEMRNKHSKRLTLEQDLKQAISEGQLYIDYQPQVEISSDKITAVEALLRWKHPDNGLIMPGDFIPLGEETGQIIPIGRWLLDEALGTLAGWRKQGLPEVVLTVNISARELVQSDFAEYVFQCLARHQIPGHLLELEITENVLMRNMEQSQLKLQQLAEQGIRVAIDDFGTGYSSLSYLQTLPLNTIKIDQSFIADIGSGNPGGTVIYAISAMAQGLGLELVAEGVESKAQLDFLKKLGCPKVQGYYTGRPSSGDSIWRDCAEVAG